MSDNPFDFGGPVSGDQFAGRTRELASVVNLLSNHRGVVLTAPRRYGKSSLMKQASLDLAKQNQSPAIVHLNLLRASSVATASGLLLKSLYQVPEGPWHLLKNALPEFMKKLRVRPSITLDDEGKPVFTFSASAAQADVLGVFDTVYEILNEIGEKRPSVLFIDEFQASLDLDSKLPWQLKGLADTYRNVSLVLAGSKQHIMDTLVSAQNAPLYQMLQPIALGPIPKDDWVPFLMDSALRAGRPFDSELTAGKIFDEAGPVPDDVQRLAFEAFSQTSTQISIDTVKQAVSELIRHSASSFAKDFEDQPIGRRRILKTLAAGIYGAPSSFPFVTQTGLANPSSVIKGLDKLCEAEIVVKREGDYSINNPFFASWLRG